MLKPLEDSDLMPFGKYKGEEMINISAFYLLWFYEQNVGISLTKKDSVLVFNYIKTNLEIFKEENEL